jgi:hypothetical protein
MNEFYSLDNGSLRIKTPVLDISFNGVTAIETKTEDNDGLSFPFTVLSATKEKGEQKYIFWEDLAVVYMPDYKEEKLLDIEGEHYTVTSVKLKAFTDDNDTLVHKNEKNLFARNLYEGMEGDIFFLKNLLTGKAVVIISETPDYQKTALRINGGAVSIDNGGYGVVLGFTDNSGCETLCREYYRHKRKPKASMMMSNTWGDRNGFSRVCHDFVKKEIDAAEDIGVDIVQIDDGWQTGSTADLTRRDELDRRVFADDFWEISGERFPEGIKVLSDYAKDKGIKLGLWFAPDSHDNFKTIKRDTEILRRVYEEWGSRFFKLDMYWIQNKTECDRFLEFLKKIYSFGDVATQLDVTRGDRVNYLCGGEYGTVFVENRYTKWGNYFPHRTLRNIWSLGRFIPTAKFQFEIVNPDLNAECYEKGDVFAPENYDLDYLFASVMLSNPLFWMEMQFLSDKRRKELQRIIPIYKELREEFADADVVPIGDMPSGRSFTGFEVRKCGKTKYLLLFRESAEEDIGVYNLENEISGSEVILSNAEAEVKITGKSVTVKFSKQRAYALIKTN